VLAGILGGLPTAPMLAEAGRREPLTQDATVAYPALFLVFFIALLVLPPVVGVLVDWTGNIRVAAGFCVVILCASFVLFTSKERYARAWKNI
jgi:MFS-type transporter involved in bile tolerance (Atg22 family)